MKKLLIIPLIAVAAVSCRSYSYICDIQSKGHGHTQAEGFKIKAGAVYKEIFNADTITVAIYKIVK